MSDKPAPFGEATEDRAIEGARKLQEYFASENGDGRAAKAGARALNAFARARERQVKELERSTGVKAERALQEIRDELGNDLRGVSPRPDSE